MYLNSSDDLCDKWAGRVATVLVFLGGAISMTTFCALLVAGASQLAHLG